MKKTPLIPTITWWLLGLLAVSAAMLALGRSENNADPSATSYNPSGLHAFADLLRSQGYRVSTESRARFRPKPGALLVGFFVTDLSDPIILDNQDRFEQSIREHVKAGGNALLLGMKKDFRQSSLHAIAGPATIEPILQVGDETQSNLKVSVSPGSESSGSEIPVHVPGTETMIWRYTTKMTFAAMTRAENGFCMTVQDGLGATNRFLDREDNAAFFLWCVRLLSQDRTPNHRLADSPSLNVIFLEAAHGAATRPTLPEMLGPWATAGLAQIYVLFVVVIFTLGKRFGLAADPRPPQRGARDLSDAMTNLFMRSRATDLALKTLTEEADRRVRGALRLPRDAPPQHRDRLLPEKLKAALNHAEQLAHMRGKTAEAVEAAEELERETDAFAGKPPHKGSHANL